MTDSLITTPLDLSKHGKHADYLRLPHSVTRSAYGWLGVPIVSIRNGSGPRVLFLAGVHGDEYEGQIALTKLARELQSGDIQGQLVILTMANYPASKAGLRTSPIDDGNLNRSFPGDAAGTPTHMIAHFIEEILLPQCDYLVDLHSGGASLFYPPTLLRGTGLTSDESEKLAVLQDAFDLPFAWVFAPGAGRQSTGRTAMAAANRKGVVSVMAELGGGGAVDKAILADTERGLRRILSNLGMLPGYQVDAQRGTRELSVQGSVFAMDSGLFEPFKDIGELVAAGEVTGTIHAPDSPLSDPIPVPSQYAGIVLCKRALGPVERGDAVFQIATDLDGTG